jgi:outer membrane protein assembly factor BamA
MAVLLNMTAPPVASAQETRADQIAAKQQEKAEKAVPYEPTRFERIMTRIEENFASPPSGFYPLLGSVYSGGGFTPGVGYRRFYARRAVWDVIGLYSVKNYKSIQFGTRTPWAGQGPWTLDARAGWLDATQVGYYGTGMNQTLPRANFRLQQAYASLTGTLRPNRWSRAQAELAYETYEIEEGQGGEPSIETIYTPDTAPGLGAAPTFVRIEGMAAIDWRRSPGYARKGGLYGVTLTNFADVDDTFSFQRLDGEIVQHLPILRETWVVSLRARVQTVLESSATVPYFLLPQLGSGRTLRGYSTGRFRDRHSLLTSAEFRWIPNRLGLDIALFYDAGKVTNRRADLDLDGLAKDWGIGARFHGPASTVLRIEAARGSDGWKLVFATSPPF